MMGQTGRRRRSVRARVVTTMGIGGAILFLAMVIGLATFPGHAHSADAQRAWYTHGITATKARGASSPGTLFGRGSEVYTSPSFSDGPQAHIRIVGLGWHAGERIHIYAGVPPNIDFGGNGDATVVADRSGRFQVALSMHNPQPGHTMGVYVIAESVPVRAIDGYSFARASFIFNY